MSARRIAIFVTSLYGGGAERQMVILANSFAERGLAVDLVVSRLDGMHGAHLGDISPAVHVVNLRARRIVLCLPGLVRYFMTRKPDACLSALREANIVAVVARGLTGRRFRLIVSERNSIPRGVEGRMLRHRVRYWLMKLTYPRADGMIAVAAGVASDVARALGLPTDQVLTILNGVQIEKVRQLAAAPIGGVGDHSVPLFLGAGRLVPAKDFPTLVRAFAVLRGQRPCRLVIIGEGQQRRALETLVHELGLGEDVSLPGYMTNPFAWMRRANVFVLSSRREGFANVVAEAMACGTRVVSTDCQGGGPREILEHGRWGRLVPVGDVKAMATAMAEALDDPNPPDVARRAAELDVSVSVDAYLRALQADSYASE